MSNEKEIKPAPFLTDPEDLDKDQKYITPNIEAKLPAHKRMECREIVKEIKSFGISQRQLLYLVYLLSLEMEDRDTMIALTEAVGDNRDNTPISSLILPGDGQG